MGGPKDADEFDGLTPDVMSNFPTFGNTEPAVKKLPPLPAEKPRGREHSSYHHDQKQEDMTPLDWRRYVVPRDPGEEFKVIDVKPEGIPELANLNISKSVDAARRWDWEAYATHSNELDAQQKMISTDYQVFMEAQRNNDLRALGFTMPSSMWSGDVSTLANQQSLTGGLTIGALFRGNGELDLDKKDNAAIDQAGKAIGHKGPTKAAHDALIGADSLVKAKLETFNSATEAVQESIQKLESATLAVEMVELEHIVDEDKEAVEAAKKNAEDIKGWLELGFGGVLKYLVLPAHEAGDVAESVGVMASWAVGRFTGKSIEAAEQKLKEHSLQLKNKQTQKAASDLEAAKTASRKTFGALKAARHELLVAMNARQAAYDKAGNSSAGATSGSATSKAKIASSMSAIPAAEFVLGLAGNLAEKAARGPRYNEEAGIGFHMAVYAAHPQATHMVNALDQVEYVRIHFQRIAQEWARRLGSLEQVQERLGGIRPSERDDVKKPGSGDES